MSASQASEEITCNILKIVDKYQNILEKLMHKNVAEQNSVMDPAKITSVMLEMVSKVMSEPDKLLEYQLSYTQNYLSLINNTMSRFMGEQAEPLYKPASKDNRFKDNAWCENAYFDFIKQSYLMTGEWINNIIQDKIANQDEKTAKKITFYTKQLIDALSPTNFALTNPQVLKETIDSKAANLVKGMEKLYQDVERSKGMINITTTDSKAFEVGVNIATTKGKVIYQNELMQLIHYQPTQAQNYQVPLLIIPPCINKFYILDLQEKNSFVKWSLDQGLSVFIVSWVNPSKELGGKSFEDYMLDGPLAAIEAIEKATGKKQINAIGYCIGGTLLSITLAYLKAKGKNPIKSATFFTTLLDFSDAGELSIFLDEEQLEFIEKKMVAKGYFDGVEVSNAFNLLRANDMIWSFFVNNYLLGKDPMPFDLLYWNSDPTRLPAAMHSFYLRNICINNMLTKKNAIVFQGEPIDLSKVDLPCYFLSTKDDHIAPWQSTYAVHKLFTGEIDFTLTGSGHIGGVVNHPANKKYSYWKNNIIADSPSEWFANAKEHPGSWWNDWINWVQKFSGKKEDAIMPENSKIGYIEDAPGSYVKVKCDF